MAKAKFEGISVKSVAVCHGPEKRTAEDETELFAGAPEQLQRVRDFVGIQTRWLASRGVTTLDLGESAVRRLLAEGVLDLEKIQAVIFVTQTPDHFQPCNANLLHGRLGLAKEVLVFDVNQGCSGWIYGLYLASSLLAGGGCGQVLLLAGDTVSQCIHPRDRTLRPLFSDACAAALVERDSGGRPWCFDLGSDGKGAGAICIPAGAHRQAAGGEAAEEKMDAEGNVRTAENLFMDGMEVFNFTLREEPRAIKGLWEWAGIDPEEIEAFVFHQANLFILQNLAKRLKIPMEKVPHQTLRDFGNQSSASIPAVWCYELGKTLEQRGVKMVSSGFGVGLSWASLAGEIGPLSWAGIFPYDAR
ncbi:MAG: ketoacyl-ACP synthase III [Opitutales bacterium]|nr:ketoacyl-ACP synthase III [Opitutales bacterium]MCH8539997.1 ketoacyl-ACP synthase III [Opitutales bacterium]